MGSTSKEYALTADRFRHTGNDIGILRSVDAHGPYRRLRSRETYVQKEFKSRGSPTKVLEWWDRLQQVAGARQYVENVGLANFLDSLSHGYDWHIYLALAERWWDSTNSFHLPACELGFTPLDFLVITGIPIGHGFPVPWSSDLSWDDLVDLFGPCFPETCLDGKFTIKMKELYEAYLGELPRLDAGETVEHVTRAFIFYTFGSLLLTTGKENLKMGYLEGLRDLDNTDMYDWGRCFLSYFLIHLSRFTRSNEKSIQGFWPMLVIWFYEYFTRGGPSEISTDGSAFLPRLRRWADVRSIENLFGGLIFKQRGYRATLENLRLSSVLSGPLMVSDIGTNPVYYRAWDISRSRHFLCGPNFGIWHFGDRLAHQLGSADLIPRSLPLAITSHSQISLENMMSLMVRENRSHDAIAPVRGDYSAYWASVSLGHVLPLEYGNALIRVEPRTREHEVQVGELLAENARLREMMGLQLLRDGASSSAQPPSSDA